MFGQHGSLEYCLPMGEFWVKLWGRRGVECFGVNVWCLIFLKQTPGEAEDTSRCLLKIQQGKELEQNSSKVLM